ncbi:hypothetical protein SAMN02799636_05957 [Methylobacterium sp. 275MFSha3.1]|uniref:hypothetical protein n=1 Tax=Methylobacterium sp. 275MFSha3.1 TaxID=1502746 RepID=UPI0008A810CD|nr:hypothetical protein [Methylobacterium sp. 275MFSha3.1]SEI14540.1 hypothetical protein SAMN02799636_05957 [Methylobacterium sp. 275MFSha3.1]
MVYELDQPDLVADHSAVVLAVRRDAEGQSNLVATRACEAGDPGYLGWLAACAQRGAVELHAYRLAETAADRAAVTADLAVLTVKPTTEAPQ